MRPVIGLVVPALLQSGGVRVAAHFLKRVIERSNQFDLRLISLATSAHDKSSRRLLAPSTWRRAPEIVTEQWEGVSVRHVGAMWAEVELQRYRPRDSVAKALSDCDLIQVVCGSPAWACVAEGLSKPLSVHCATLARVERRRRDSKPEGALGYWRKAMTAFTSRMDVRALRRADAIQVMNTWLFEYARTVNKGRSVDLKLLPPGVNTHVFHPLESRISNTRPYILCVGRLNDPRKNVGLLLHVLKELPANVRSQTRLILGGQAAPPETFWKTAAEFGVRDFIEFVHRPTIEALVSLYQHAAVFVLPSDEEGFGLVLLEAMACGVPIVSTRSGGPDDILTDGNDGFLVSREDYRSIASRVLMLLSDKQLNAAMGKQGRLKVEKRYDEVVVGESFVSIWERLLSARNSKPGDWTI